MSETEAKKSVSRTDDLEPVYRSGVSNVTMAETPTHQPIGAFSVALRHSLCSYADYLYFNDTYLSHCVQEPSHIQHQQVGVTNFRISKVVIL